MKSLDEWVKSLTNSHPDLKGHSICPFAKSNTYKIVKSSINDIKPLNEVFGVVIFVDEYLQVILENDYNEVQKIRNK